MPFPWIAAAILAAAGAQAYSSKQASKSAQKIAQQQQEYLSGQYAPSKAFEEAQLEDYMKYMRPYYGDISDLWKQYGKGITEEQYKLTQDILQPTTRQMGGMMQAELTQPFQLPESVWQGTWQKARERTLGEYEPIERRTTQRLAATGGLGQGPAEALFKDIDLSKARSIENLAIEQALAEWNEKKAAKQQSYENIFRLLGGQGGVVQPQTQTGAIGGAIQPYTEIPQTGIDWGQATKTGIGTYDLLSRMFGTTPTMPTSTYASYLPTSTYGAQTPSQFFNIGQGGLF